MSWPSGCGWVASAGLLTTVGRTADARTARAGQAVLMAGHDRYRRRRIDRAGSGHRRGRDGRRPADNGFGHLVIAKTGLLGVLAALGAVNHFRNVPAAGRTLGGLRRVGSVELLVGATVLLLSASLVNLAPPVEVVAAARTVARLEPAPLTVEGNDFGTSVRVRLEVSPGTAGFDTFTATVIDYDSRAPVAADGVSLRFVFPARSDVGSSRLDLAPTGAGVFTSTGTNCRSTGHGGSRRLSSMGHPRSRCRSSSRLERVGRPHRALDRHQRGARVADDLHRPPDRRPDRPGLPRPGTPGANEVHATFFDAAGTELPVARSRWRSVPPADRSRRSTPRQLEPGHFVADTTLAAGTYSCPSRGRRPEATSSRPDLISLSPDEVPMTNARTSTPSSSPRPAQPGGVLRIASGSRDSWRRELSRSERHPPPGPAPWDPTHRVADLHRPRSSRSSGRRPARP